MVPTIQRIVRPRRASGETMPTNHAVVSENNASEAMNFAGLVQTLTPRQSRGSRPVAISVGSSRASISRPKRVSVACRSSSSCSGPRRKAGTGGVQGERVGCVVCMACLQGDPETLDAV